MVTCLAFISPTMHIVCTSYSRDNINFMTLIVKNKLLHLLILYIRQYTIGFQTTKNAKKRMKERKEIMD